MGLLKVPLDVKDFRLFVKDGYLFADKSLLIRDLLNSGSASILFTRPRRFGKTLAISMLDRFFNIAYREEESEDDTFSGLRISECPEYPGWASEGGVKNSYLVIRLDMSAITFRDCESFTKRLTEYLMRMVDSKFGYLADSPVLRSTLDDCLFRDFDGSISDSAQILINICDVLTRHHGVKPVILLDEYDSPFNRAYGTSWFDDFIQYYGDLLRVSLKANENTSRVIMTGVQRIVVGGMFSSLNDFEHVGVNNRAYGEYFGITSDEMSSLVSDMARQRVPEEDSSKLDEIIAENFELAVKWFDGYRIGGKDIFNPWSSMNFINNHVCTTIPPRQYWNDTAEHRIMIRLFSEVDDSILNDVKVAYVSGKPIEVSQILDVTPLWKSGQNLDRDELYSLLLFAGYLTADFVEGRCVLSIPNYEVKLNFNDLMQRVYCISIPSVIDLMVHISSKDAVAVKNDLERLMSGGSYLDGWGESRYKSWMHDLFALHGYTSVTEWEMGEGRTDLIVKGDGRSPSILFEFKVVEPESDEDLADAVEEGLKQIIDRRYLDGSEMEGAITLSVAFRRKTCEVAFIDPV